MKAIFRRNVSLCLICAMLAGVMPSSVAETAPEVLWTNYNSMAPEAGALREYVYFELDSPCTVTEIETRHINPSTDAQGQIMLYAEDGSEYGPFPAWTGALSEGETRSDVLQVAYVDIPLAPGRYAIGDSDMDTWASNAVSNFWGLAQVRGYYLSPDGGGEIQPSSQVLPGDCPHVLDDGGLFTDEERAEIEQALILAGQWMDAELAVATTRDAGGLSEGDYALSRFTAHGFGTNATKDGAMYLIDLDNKKIIIHRSGFLYELMSDGLDQTILTDACLTPVNQGRYAASAMGFAEQMAALAGGSIDLPQADAPAVAVSRDGQLTYTLSEIAAAPAVRASVSPEAPVVSAGVITVDMMAWNLDGADELLVRTLPEKSADGITMRGYDFSLASGQSDFITAVEVRIPCTAAQDEDCCVQLLNDETGLWEFIGYEVSENKEYYTVYMPHFSTIREKTSRYLAEETNLDAVKDYTVDANLYQYVRRFDPDGFELPLVECEVGLPDESFKKLMATVDRDALYSLLANGGSMPSNDATAALLATLNNTVDFADGIALAAEFYGSIGATTSTVLGSAFSGAGVILTTGRMVYQASKGGDLLEILNENKYDIISGALGATSVFTGNIAFAVASVGVYAVSLIDAYLGSYEYDGFEERVYNAAMECGYVSFYPDSGTFARTGAQTGGIVMDMHGKGMAAALRSVYDRYQSEPALLEERIEEFYTGFAACFWEERYPREEVVRELILRYGRNAFVPAPWDNDNLPPSPEDAAYEFTEWIEPTEAAKSQYRLKVRQRVVSETRTILYAFARDAYYKLEKQVYDLLWRKVIPMLNSKATFNVIDPALPEGATFDQSPFAGNISFADRAAAKFSPRYMPLSAYTPDVYRPRARKDSNEVFTCTLYHYIQMGCPNTMEFVNKITKETVRVPFSYEYLYEAQGGAGNITVYLPQLEEPSIEGWYAGTAYAEYGDGSTARDDDYSGNYLLAVGDGEYRYIEHAERTLDEEDVYYLVRKQPDGSYAGSLVGAEDEAIANIRMIFNVVNGVVQMEAVVSAQMLDGSPDAKQYIHVKQVSR